MARFFVGQRVRIVRTHSGTRLLGSECRIVAWEQHAYSRSTDEFYSGWRLDVLNVRGNSVIAPEGYIEPITDIYEPCESDFKESLDKLLEGLPA